MSILKISRLGHPILLQKCKLVKNITGDKTKRIIHDMTETMLDAKGIGLAAPQVHINKQIIIFRDPDEENQTDIKITALINPKIIKIILTRPGFSPRNIIASGTRNNILVYPRVTAVARGIKDKAVKPAIIAPIPNKPL